MSQSKEAQTDRLVDVLMEDEAERESLLAKPTCFIIVGRPGVGKSTLAKNIAETWKCILVDDTDLLNTHIENKTEEGIELSSILSEGRSVPEDMVLQLILTRLNSADVEHYGYVLSCLPFLSEECLKIDEQIDLIKSLKLTPDFIVNIKCSDADLVQRLSGLKQLPETGQLYSRDQWQRQEVVHQQENRDEEKVQPEEKDLQKDITDKVVRTPENLARNALARINMYKDIMLRPLENYMMDHNPLYLLELDGKKTPEELLSCVMSRLGSMAINRVAIPVLLHQPDDEELPVDIDTEDLLRGMSSCRTVAPGFRWRRSRWGQTCPVALKEGKVIPGKPELYVGFQDKLYVLSSQEALQKFRTNPRRYLLPPMPRPPCRVAIVGPPQAGKSTLCSLLAEHYDAVVLDMEALVQPVLAKVEQERLDRIQEETIQMAIEKVKMNMEPDGDQNSVTDNHPEVQAIVLAVLEEAKLMSTAPVSLYAEVLESHIKEIEEAADTRCGWVLDNFPKNLSQMETLQEAGLLPDILFCLRDADGSQVLKRLYEMDKESVDQAIGRRLQDQQSEETQALNQTEQESEAEAQPAEQQTQLGTVVEETEGSPEQSNPSSPRGPDVGAEASPAPLHVAQAAVQPDYWELGYPDGPEMNEYKLQLQQFATEWEQMQSSLSVAHSVLEIGEKSPEILLQEMILQMEKTFQYLSWELSEEDINEEMEDIEALSQFERTVESSSDKDTAEEEDEQGDMMAMRLLGDTLHFCPVALKNHNTLQPCTDKIAAKYREKTFFFSTEEARDSFLQNPAQFVAETDPLKPPALRIFLLGPRGSGKTTHGEWLAQQLGLFHIQFREQLKMLIMAKIKKTVPCADEVESVRESPEDLEALIREARVEDHTEMEDVSACMDDVEQEAVLTDEEEAIKSYLSGGDPLSPHILDTVIEPYWKQEPYMSTGFILEGFPHNPKDVQYMLQQQLFPDLVVIMAVEASDVQKRLLPGYLEKWRVLCDWREAQQNLLRVLRQKARVESIAKRRAELVAELSEEGAKTTFIYSRLGGEFEEDDSADAMEDEIEDLLEEEFPPEEHDKDEEDEESEEAAYMRLERKIEERFFTDESGLVHMMELLIEQNIPQVTISASLKIPTVQHQLLQRVQPLLSHRESLFQRCRPISPVVAQRLLLSAYKRHSAFGCWDPVKQHRERGLIQPVQWPLSTTHPLIFHQYIYFFASKENRKTFMLNPLKYLRQPKPHPPLPVKMAVVGPPKSGKTTVAQMFAEKHGLARLSIGAVMRTILDTQEHTDLAVQMKKYLSQGLVVPDELAIQCLEVALMSSVCSTRGYVLDGYPKTIKQAELMASRSIIPMIVVELELDTMEVLRRGLNNKMKPISSESLYIHNLCYKQEVEQVRQHFQQEYQNWIPLDGLKSKWWLWNSILKEVSISMKYIQSYLEKTSSGQAACINKLCVTPSELQTRSGEFSQYCPVCLALHRHLVDCSETAALTHAADYRGKYYKMCGRDHLESFLNTPDQFVSPCCPNTLPQPHLLPAKLTESQVNSRLPQQVEMQGFCPVTYLEGAQRYEALVRGKIEYAVQYREQIYIFETQQKQDMFLRSPETYWDQQLPSKIVALCEAVLLSSLPSLGYLEQGVAVALIKALTAAVCLKPKHPFLGVQKSALLYLAYYLKAFNHKSKDHTKQTYRKTLALFEENCALIPFLSSTFRGKYRPPSERPVDFDFKLNRFLTLRDLPGASTEP